MPTKRMLIDAAHPEETRVAIVEDERLLDHDVEVASRRQLKGNIYLAKVTRVEPSLQAAFVDYGGNRHGFLAFSEIHPDYYQIPVADREKLLAEQQAAEASESDEERDDDGNGGLDEDELEVRRPRLSPRHYKIQEVIKRRQIMLVQVAKEERGTKGAALTTYLSLAGRYCVLMPNTTRGGGISRKITSGTDRKRLKKIVGELDIPEGMAVILRTAGAERSKAEIKRDYEYLMRMWSTIRELTLKSMAPTLVYEEGNLIKRSIRDLYDRTTEEILIEGEPAYRTAKEFMKLFIPSHAKRVKLYEDERRPLFQRYNVEAELEAMHAMTVELRSGGSIVINPTEALVSIDVNSGRATRERHIEETALRTNVEACDEIARQLRLRDLAGLIVIDFIDMEVTRNQGQVERRLREAMKTDRARVQFGRISPFGLLELSRQRLRPSLWETSYEICAMCSGAGVRRSTESAALSILRRIEAEGLRDNTAHVTVTASAPVALYLLNQKRRSLLHMEERYQVEIDVLAAHEGAATLFEVETRVVAREDEAAEAATTAEQAGPAAETEAAGEEREDGTKRGRRRRPRRRKRPEEETAAADVEVEEAAEAAAEDEEPAAADAAADTEGEVDAASDAEAARKRRRRGKRGGRRRARRPGEDQTQDDQAQDEETEEMEMVRVDHLPEAGTLLAAPVEVVIDAGSALPEPETVIYVSSTAEAEVAVVDAGHEPQEAPAEHPAPLGESAPAAEPPVDDAGEAAGDAAERREAETEAAADDARVEAAEPDAAAFDETVVDRAEADAGDGAPHTMAAAARAHTDDEVPAGGTAGGGNGHPDDEDDEEGATSTAQTDPEASRTVVINVGDSDSDGDGRRRGWWQRLIN